MQRGRHAADSCNDARFKRLGISLQKARSRPTSEKMDIERICPATTTLNHISDIESAGFSLEALFSGRDLLRVRS
jgi:hypothetical protein